MLELVSRGHRHRPRPARGVPAPRSSRTASSEGPARRAARRAHLGRRDPRDRRLPRGRRARRDLRRHDQRGLRDREHGRRRVPAREHVVADPPRRARRRARRRRPGRRRRRCRSGSARRPRARPSSRRRCPSCARDVDGAARPRGGVAGARGRARERAGARGGRRPQVVAEYLARDRARARRLADAAATSCSSASSTTPAACSSSLHAPFGGRINRGLGLLLRKRFCRSFDFELQAAANDDAIVLSLGPQHSFPLDERRGFSAPRGVARRADSGRAARRRCSRCAGAGT